MNLKSNLQLLITHKMKELLVYHQEYLTEILRVVGHTGKKLVSILITFSSLAAYIEPLDES